MSSTKPEPAFTGIFGVIEDLMTQITERNIIKDGFREFNGIKENHLRVNFIHRHLVDLGCMDKILLETKLRQEKCNKRSTEIRMLGNDKFKKKNFYEAFELFNKSICYAESCTDNLSIGYANRSAVLFELKYYRECLANIELARKANYPSRFMHKLEKREKDCLRLVESQPPDEKPHNFQLSFESHPHMPHISKCLELHENAEEGRFVVTNRKLLVGDMIVTEEPFCTTLYSNFCHKRCAAVCNNKSYFTLIPCENCCSVMFCSEGCHHRAVSTFHKYECPIIDFLQSMFAEDHFTALRICLSTLELFSTIDELMVFCAASENQNKSAFDLDYKNLTPQEHYRAIHGLVTNQHLRSTTDFLYFSVVCAVLKHYLIKCTPLKEFLGGEKGESFFTGLLFRHLQTAPLNTHATGFRDFDGHPFKVAHQASGVYAFMSLINHSCSPNVMCLSHGTKMYLFVMRPIPAGGKIYDFYEAHYAEMSKAERFQFLSVKYMFTCKCEACENDYPNMHILQPKCGVPYADMKIVLGDGYALKNYKKLCEYLTKYGHAYPCDQILWAERYLLFTVFQLL